MDELRERLWTVMVYMVGDAGLDYNGFTDLKEMKRAGSTAEVALLAQFCRGVKNRPAKRYYLSRDGRDGTLAGDVVEDLGETNPARPETLVEFLQWGIEKFPARHYLAVLWGHSNGADDETLPHPILSSPGEDVCEPGAGHARPPTARGRSPQQSRAVVIAPSAASFDPYSLDCLDSRRFKKALESVRAGLGRKLDILGMDSCLMSGAEICYQVRDSVNLTVAPEGLGPVDGWPYDKILNALVENPEIKPEELAVTIAEKFVASYADCEGLSITQSVCDLGKCDLLASAIDKLAGMLVDKLADDGTKKAVMLARWQAQSYENTEYIDLYDFCSLLQEHCDNGEVKVACGGVMETIATEGFVLRSLYQGDAVQYSYGLSIYFPLHEVSRSYEKLDFARDTCWIEFLKEYVRKTRRPGRNNRDGFELQEYS